MTTTPDIELRHEVLLAFQVALLGMVTPSLRGVTVTWSPQIIEGLLLYEGTVTDDDHEVASDIEAELIAGFPNASVRVRAETCAPPARLNDRTLKAWVYRRKE